MKDPLRFDKLFHNDAVYWVEQKWQRRLNDHEKHLAGMIYDFVRTQVEVEELKILDIKGTDLHDRNDY